MEVKENSSSVYYNNLRNMKYSWFTKAIMGFILFDSSYLECHGISFIPHFKLTGKQIYDIFLDNRIKKYYIILLVDMMNVLLTS